MSEKPSAPSADLALIEELEALATKATPGPWNASREDMDSYTESPESDGEAIPVAYVYRKPEERIPVYGDAFRDDSRLIVAAINSLPRLLALAREALAGREDTARLDWIEDTGARGWYEVEKARLSALDYREAIDAARSAAGGSDGDE